MQTQGFKLKMGKKVKPIIEFFQNIKSFCKQNSMLRIHSKPDKYWHPYKSEYYYYSLFTFVLYSNWLFSNTIKISHLKWTKKNNKTIKRDIKTTTIFEIISCTNHILWMKWKKSHFSVRVVREQRNLHPLRTNWS